MAKKKRKGRGKGKGSSFEREMCRTLSEWWSKGHRDDLFWRTAGSGGMAKTRGRMSKQTFGQYGDIQATDPKGQPFLDAFVVELKRGYNKYTIADMFDKPSSAKRPQLWESQFLQVEEDWLNSDAMYWMLISKRDRREALLCIPARAARRLRSQGAEGLEKNPHVRGYVVAKKKKKEEKVAFYLTTLSNFLESVQPKHIKSLLLTKHLPRP